MSDPTAGAPDPFAPQPGPDATAFRQARWQRAGANEDEVAELQAYHDGLEPTAQAAEDSAIDATSDNALTQALDAMRAGGGFTGYQASTPAEAPPETPPAQAAKSAAPSAGQATPQGSATTE